MANGTKLIDEVQLLKNMTGRISVLEKYGIYTSLADLKNAEAGSFPYTLIELGSRTEYTYVPGDFTGKIDNVNIVALSKVSSSTGALVKADSSGISFIQNFSSAAYTNIQRKLSEHVSITDFYNGEADYTIALQKALNAKVPIFIPKGEYIIDKVTGSDVFIYGNGTLRKKPNTKGVLLGLTGRNRIEHVTFDYDWENCDQSPNYFNNLLIDQVKGSLTLSGVKCIRSFTSAIYVLGGSLFTDAGCSFTKGAPHNNLTNGQERTTHYIFCTADAETKDQVISIDGGYFEGTSLDIDKLHLNPTGILITASAIDGARYKTVNINNAVLLGCSTNAGNGNVTGAIDTYNGAENIIITGCTIRFYTYAAIKIQNSSNFVITGNTLNSGYVPSGAFINHSLGIATIEKARNSVVEQRNGTISFNLITNTQYTAITNSCDYVTIIGNVIGGVKKIVLGNAIYNTGNHVLINKNMTSAIEGVQLFTAGDYVDIEGNDLESGAGADPSQGENGIFWSGTGIKIRDNRFRSTLPSVHPCIRTNGNCFSFEIKDNTINGFSIGVDLRTTAGPVDNGFVGNQRFTNVTTPYNIVGTSTNITRQNRLLQPITVAYDPPSLEVGSSSTIQTTTIPGISNLVHRVEIIPVGINPRGLEVRAYISASDTVNWYVYNPTGNPSGTVDLGSVTWKFLITELAS